MKSFIVFALFVAAAAALPVDPPKDAVVKSYTFDNIGVGGYSFGYETSDGKYVNEQAVVKNVGLENEGIEVVGKYSFFAPDGTFYEVTYTAGEKGFQPQGSHLPKN